MENENHPKTRISKKRKAMKHYPSLKTLVGSAAVIALLALSLVTSLCGYDAKTMSVEAMNEDTTTDMYECNTLEDGSKVYCNAREKMGPDFIQCPYYTVTFYAKIKYESTGKTEVISDGPYGGWTSDVFTLDPNFRVPSDATIENQWSVHNSEPRLVHGVLRECEPDGVNGGTCSPRKGECSDLYLGTAS